MRRRTFLGLGLGALASSVSGCAARPRDELLNVSYDASRELYQRISDAFLADTTRAAGVTRVRASHGGSGKQARSVLEGLAADVVSLGLPFDVDALVPSGLVSPDWRTRFPHDAAPFTSTVVLLVRPGNPLGIRGFEDLAREGVSVITPNPKTSGGARWNHLAAWGAILRSAGRREADAYLARLYANVPVLDPGARSALTTFAERRIGDVMLAWESEARLSQELLGPGRVEIVTPRASIVAETPVAVVDRVVDRRGTREVAEAYLSFLFEPTAQAIGAAQHLRPRLGTTSLPDLERFTVADVVGTWSDAHREHFADGALLDRILEARR